MKKITRTLCLLLALAFVVGMVQPISVNAQETVSEDLGFCLVGKNLKENEGNRKYTYIDYTESKKKPKVYVYNYDAELLTEGKDYYIAYWENDYYTLGYHTVRVIGINDYKGTWLDGKYYCWAKDLSSIKNVKTTVKKNKITVKWAKNKLCQKYIVEYSTSKNFELFEKNVTTKFVKTTKNSYTIKNLRKNKKYYIRVIGFTNFKRGQLKYMPDNTITLGVYTNNSYSGKKLGKSVLNLIDSFREDAHFYTIGLIDSYNERNNEVWLYAYSCFSKWSKTKTCKTK